MKLDSFKTDQSKEVEGMWVDAGSGLQLKIARINNPKYESYLQSIGRPIRHKIQRGSANNSEIEDIAKRAMAKYVLLDWHNLQDDSEGTITGQPHSDVQYSEERALKILREYREFFFLVQDMASDAEMFRQDYEEEAKGNSESASDGS